MELKRNELEKVMGRVIDDSKIINEIVNKIEERYAKDLNDFMLKVEQLLKRERELTDGELEEIVLKIPVFLYFAVQGLETLGVESDMAKAVKEEIAAEVFLKAEGTIPDKTKTAEMATQKEHIIAAAFARAYRKLKMLIDKAELLFSGASKIHQKRITELSIRAKEEFYNRRVGIDGDKF